MHREDTSTCNCALSRSQLDWGGILVPFDHEVMVQRKRSILFVLSLSSSKTQPTKESMPLEPTIFHLGEYNYNDLEIVKQSTLVAVCNLASGLGTIVSSAIDRTSCSNAHVLALVSVVINAWVTAVGRFMAHHQRSSHENNKKKLQYDLQTYDHSSLTYLFLKLGDLKIGWFLIISNEAPIKMDGSQPMLWCRVGKPHILICKSCTVQQINRISTWAGFSFVPGSHSGQQISTLLKSRWDDQVWLWHHFFLSFEFSQVCLKYLEII